LMLPAEGDAALEPVPKEIKTPRAGGNALGTVASILSVLRLMYGTYTEAPSAPPAAAGAGPAGAAAAAGGSGGGSVAAAAAAAVAAAAVGKVVQSVPGVDHVADYRLAVQMWLPRDTNHNNRCVNRRVVRVGWEVARGCFHFWVVLFALCGPLGAREAHAVWRLHTMRYRTTKRHHHTPVGIFQ
jgi:hypothetical protein